MEATEVIEGNRLIAQFDGWKLRVESFENSSKEKYPWWEKFENNQVIKTYHHDILSGNGRYEWGNYATSWDWLMPVVEKIFKIVWYDANFDNQLWGENFEASKINRLRIHADIEATWLAVVDFVKFYNQNMKG